MSAGESNIPGAMGKPQMRDESESREIWKEGPRSQKDCSMENQLWPLWSNRRACLRDQT